MGRNGCGLTSSERDAEAAARRFSEQIGELKEPHCGYFAPNFVDAREIIGEGPLYVKLDAFSESKDDFINEIKAILNRKFYQPETIRKYLVQLKSFLDWLTVPLNRVNENCLNAYISDVIRRSAGNAVLYQGISALRTIFDDICGLTVTENLKLPGTRKETTIIQASDLQAVFNSLQACHDKLLLCLLLTDQCSVNALLNIRKKDIDFKKQHIRVWLGLGRRERLILFPEELVWLVKKSIHDLSNDDYIFSSERKPWKALTVRAVNKRLKKDVGMSGLKVSINCQIIKRTGKHIEQDSMSAFFSSINDTIKRQKLTRKEHQGEIQKKSTYTMNVVVDQFEKDGYDISAKGEVVVKAEQDRHIHLRNVSITKYAPKEQPSVALPASLVWLEALKWVPRDAAEKLCSPALREKIVCYFQQIFEKRRQEIGYIPEKKKKRRSFYGW